MKPGWYLKGNRWVECEFIAGPYEFKDAVRIRVGGHELLCQGSEFTTRKPLTESQLATVERKKAIAERRESEKQSRQEFVSKVMAALDTPKTLLELREATGFGAQAIFQRIAYWREFANVWLKDGKYHKTK